MKDDKKQEVGSGMNRVENSNKSSPHLSKGSIPEKPSSDDKIVEEVLKEFNKMKYQLEPDDKINYKKAFKWLVIKIAKSAISKARKAERTQRFSCGICGQDGILRLCDECRDKQLKNAEQRIFGEIEKNFTVTKYSDMGLTLITARKEEWEKLKKKWEVG